MISASTFEHVAVSQGHLQSLELGRGNSTRNGIKIPVKHLLLLLLFVALHTSNAQDCNLVVPANPLTAKGLATPYLMSGCDMANGSPSFVECAVFNPATKLISVYHPLVINQGTTPAFPPVVPSLPANAVVGCWFGTNGNSLTLKSAPGTNSLAQGNCVNGLSVNGQLSIFGQFAYCNAQNFFQTVNSAKITIPALGNDLDGMPCPTTREFAVVDQDQSDNVDTVYLLTPDGRTAQFTKANQNKCQGCTMLTNGSDNRLVEVMDGVLKCPQFTGNVLEDPGTQSPALALNELLAAARQGSPPAIVPDGHAMCLVNGQPNQQKRNLYRVGVNQDPNASGDTKTYCRNMANITPTRFVEHWQKFFTTQPSPAADVGNNLYNFVCARYQAAFGADNLNCVALLGIPSPITVNVDNNGVATGCIIKPVQV